ncbi:MAG: hypothetical protein K2X81_29270, partial [Candidatus Obscuribacterales bacterium]|nr:hypothetical protein [Candidatus Obscuribacterales bacterium]
FVSDKTDPNVRKAFEYLNKEKLAVAADITKSKASKMMDNGLDSRTYNALKNAVGLNNHEASSVSAVAADKIDSNMNFSPTRKAAPKSSTEMLQFLKDSGVNFTNQQQEKAVMALLEGKPIPAEVPEKKVNSFKAETAQDAEKVLKEAKERNLPVIVHAPTAICEGNNCKVESLDPTIEKELEGKAIFMEIPRGGLKTEGAPSEEIKQINEQFKVSADDHKTRVDLSVFKYGQDSKLEQLNGMRKAALSTKLPLFQQAKDKEFGLSGDFNAGKFGVFKDHDDLEFLKSALQIKE